jgi:hypothetical protein
LKHPIEPFLTGASGASQGIAHAGKTGAETLRELKALKREEKLRSEEIKIFVEFADEFVKSYDQSLLQNKIDELEHSNPAGALKIIDFLQNLNQVSKVQFFFFFFML